MVFPTRGSRTRESEWWGWEMACALILAINMYKSARHCPDTAIGVVSATVISKMELAWDAPSSGCGPDGAEHTRMRNFPQWPGSMGCT